MASTVIYILQNQWCMPRNPIQCPAPSTLTCVQLIRERMLYMILKNSHRYHEIWHMSRDQQVYTVTPPQHVIDDMQAGPSKFVRFREIALMFDAHRFRGCRSCTHDRDGSQTNSGTPARDDAPDHLSYNNDRRNFSPHRSTFPRVQISDHRPIEPSAESIPLRMQNGHVQTHTPNDDDSEFDDYDSAPVVTAQDDNISAHTWSFDSDGNFLLETCWRTWIDRGFRLKRRFFCMFPDGLPDQHREHLLPTREVGTEELSNDTDGSESSSWSSGCETSLSDSGLSSPIQISTPDLPDVTLGLQDMLDEAGHIENTVESQEVFVCGKSRSGELFRLDPMKDGIKVSGKEVQVSPDLDSLIYTTYNLNFRGAMHLHLLPFVSHRAAFWKNNHVSVKVLCPPSQSGFRSNVVNTYTLNQIPHTHFGQLGAGAVQFNIYVFFPRMIQKHPRRNYMLNMVPLPVQDLWLGTAVIPAAREVFQDDFPGTVEYVPWSLEQLRLSKGGNRGPKTLPISPDCLVKFQMVLRRRILDNPELLQRFGSFFFVVDSRGIKLLSKQYTLENNPQSAIQYMLPFLNIQHMMDRECGELILDLGISYHPPDDGEPVVGLWKLAELNKSYRMMGTKQGRIHYTCTLDGYGGRQAELGKARKLYTQILSRSAYNLVFELVRVGGRVEYLCSEADSIRAGCKYMEKCQAWKDLFIQARSKSFGVREEVRGSAVAILDLFTIASAKVRLFTKFYTKRISHRYLGTRVPKNGTNTLDSIHEILFVDLQAVFRASEHPAEDVSQET
jgi:hypothetical protein